MYIKLTFIGLLFLVLSRAEAYKISPELTWLNEDPSIGETVAVGVVTETFWGWQYFNGERGWTAYPTKFRLKNNKPFGPSKVATADVRYLFYSTSVTKTNGELHPKSEFGLTPLNSEKAKEAIAKLANKKNFAGDINPSWQFCEKDEECTQSKNQCGNLVGVNLKFQKNYLDFLELKNKKVECPKAAPSEVNKTGVSKCIDNFCS